MSWFNNQDFWEEAAEKKIDLNIAIAIIKDTVQKLNINLESQYIKQIAGEFVLQNFNNKR